jgi:hypothetical protein
MRGNELIDRSEAAAVEVARHSVSPHRIGVDDSDEPHRRTLLGKLVVNPRMVTAKRSRANHGDVNEIIDRQFLVRSRPVAGRLVDLNTKDYRIRHPEIRTVDYEVCDQIIKSAPFSAARSDLRGKARAERYR